MDTAVIHLSGATMMLLTVAPLLVGWLLDLLLGDPARLLHPVVGFGRLIAFGERWLNRGAHRVLKGGLLAVGLVALTAAAVWGLKWGLTAAAGALAELFGGPEWLPSIIWPVTATVLIFYSLAGTTLVKEVRGVFRAVDRSVEEGRVQVARIVGRDTSRLTAQEVRTAALETLAENLSDGVVAPLFWLAVGGVPAMMAYKMVNTLDSMIGYRTERYASFGSVAARLDDAANFIPARLTALLMILLAGRKAPSLRERWRFLLRFGRAHASPNSGWPEAALAGVLGCRFGGAHDYFGERVEKPRIGTRERPLTTADMRRALRLNRRAEAAAILLAAAIMLLKAAIPLFE